MKILTWHATELRIESGIGGKKESKRRNMEKRLRRELGNALAPLTDSNRVICSADALLVFSCVEQNDGSLDLREPGSAIIRSRAMLGVAQIVIGAFGHLSDRPADTMLARRIVDELYVHIREGHAQTTLVPFGWDKSLEMKVPLHHYNCGFLSFDPD